MISDEDLSTGWEGPIWINSRDKSRLPTFEYIPTNEPGSNDCIDILMNTRHGCPCGNNGIECGADCECGSHYSRNEENRLVLVHSEKAIFECNINCLCPPTCDNRLLQNGCDRPLRAKFVDEQRGFGLFAEQRIFKGEFVIEYTGEVVTTEDAIERLQEIKETHRMNYIMAVKESFAIDDTSVNVHIDAERKGNAARLINHSCEPNCILHSIHVENQFPRIGIFALTCIEQGDELTYDYGDINSKLGDTKCLCGSRQCRGFVPCDD